MELFSILGNSRITPADLLVVGGLLALMAGMGVWVRRATGTRDFFVGERRIPMWAACLAFVATEVSAVTLISVPATAYQENWRYLQFFIGSAAARLIIAFLFIPAFYRFDCVTIYQYLGRRFGRGTQVAASFFFFVTRLLGSGVRLMAACLALSVLLGWPIAPVIGLLIVVSIVYMALGGLRAVVWTNVLQALIFLSGGVAALLFLYVRSDGGLALLWDTAHAAGRTSLWHLGPGPGPEALRRFFADPNILWIAILNGFFGSLAAFGTDQDLMQRLLSVETRRESQRAMVFTTLASLATLLIYLSIGTGLFIFYSQHPGATLPAKADAVFPHFIGHEMPPLLRGWLLGAILLASIDSPLLALSTSFVTDVARPLRRTPRDEAADLRLSRIGVVVFGGVLAALAYVFSFYQNYLWLAFKIGGVTFGSLLGVFLLGLITRRRANRANILAMTISAAVNALLWYLSEQKLIALGWSWMVIIGTVNTFVIAWILGPRLEKEDESPC